VTGAGKETPKKEGGKGMRTFLRSLFLGSRQRLEEEVFAAREEKKKEGGGTMNLFWEGFQTQKKGGLGKTEN